MSEGPAVVSRVNAALPSSDVAEAAHGRSPSPSGGSSPGPVAPGGPITWFVHTITRRTPIMAWRLIFVVYAICLTIGTHLPTLRPPGQAFIPTDKIMHLFAFAGFAGFLMLTRWLQGPVADASAVHVEGSRPGPHQGNRKRERHRPAFTARNIIRCGVVALVWATLDEISQGLPILEHRYVTWQDALANTLGVVIAVAVAWMVFRRVEAKLHAPDATAGLDG